MRLNKDCWLLTKPIAHRGLWGEGVNENSLSAYRRAVEFGYPIEIDVYPTLDGEIVCFHDSTLDRMTGESGIVENKTIKELKSLRLLGTEDTIPTFDEVLAVCEGKTPLLIEIKPHKQKGFVEKIVSRLKSYKGEFALQSFNPLYINKVKKLAPEFIRGILGTELFVPTTTKKERFAMKTLFLNFLIKPDFISYSYSGFPLKKKRLPKIAWTVTSQQIADGLKGQADNIIFENFIPKKQSD